MHTHEDQVIARKEIEEYVVSEFDKTVITLKRGWKKCEGSDFDISVVLFDDKDF